VSRSGHDLGRYSGAERDVRALLTIANDFVNEGGITLPFRDPAPPSTLNDYSTTYLKGRS